MAHDGFVVAMSSVAERLSFCHRVLSSVASAHLCVETSALYLWGSVLSPEFDEDRSDVDLLVLATEIDPAAAATMRDSACALHSFFRRLDVTIAPASPQLRLLEKPFDRLDPVIVFSQLPTLQYLWGNQRLADAVAAAPSSAELLSLRLRSLRRRLRLHDHDAVDEPLWFVVKEMGFICHLVHEVIVGAHPFSYSGLLRNVNDDTRAAVELLLRFRCRPESCTDRDTVFATAAALQRAATRPRF